MITIPGIDRIMRGIELIFQWINNYHEYEANYPANYQYGIDPVPELEIVYTWNAEKLEDCILDYYIPVKVKSL